MSLTEFTVQSVITPPWLFGKSWVDVLLCYKQKSNSTEICTRFGKNLRQLIWFAKKWGDSGRNQQNNSIDAKSLTDARLFRNTFCKRVINSRTRSAGINSRSSAITVVIKSLILQSLNKQFLIQFHSRSVITHLFSFNSLLFFLVICHSLCQSVDFLLLHVWFLWCLVQLMHCASIADSTCIKLSMSHPKHC